MFMFLGLYFGVEEFTGLGLALQEHLQHFKLLKFLEVGCELIAPQHILVFKNHRSTSPSLAQSRPDITLPHEARAVTGF